MYTSINTKSSALTSINWFDELLICYKWVIATFIIATFKNTLLDLFLSICFRYTVCLKATRQKELYVPFYKNLLFWESKGTSKKTEHWVRREGFHLDSQQYSNFQQQTQTLSQSHTRHCTSPPHSSIVYRVTINVGFHRNNKMLTKTKCKHSCHYRNVANCQKPQNTSEAVAQILQNSTCSFCSV